jgi:hypothetical protein
MVRTYSASEGLRPLSDWLSARWFCSESSWNTRSVCADHGDLSLDFIRSIFADRLRRLGLAITLGGVAGLFLAWGAGGALILVVLLVLGGTIYLLSA